MKFAKSIIILILIVNSYCNIAYRKNKIGILQKIAEMLGCTDPKALHDEGLNETRFDDCSLCLKRTVDIVFKPCNHTACTKCYIKLNRMPEFKCHVCMEAIKDVVKINK